MRRPLTLKDHHQEQRIFTLRLLVAAALVIVLSSVLLGRMAWLQITEHKRYITLSDKNRIQTQSIAPPRGLITDRHGNRLAENLPDFSLEVVLEQAGDLSVLLKELATLVELDEGDLERFERHRAAARRPWAPVPLRSRLSEDEIARLVVNQYRFPGVRIAADPVRHYPHDDLLSHLVGYVNRINIQDLDAMTLEEQRNYNGTHFYGRTGIERAYESHLHGTAGYRKVETNARGRILRVLEEQPPVPGKDLALSLSLPVQQAADQALGDYRGAIVAIDPRDGQILAFVSKPGFDPNLFVTGISHQDFARYNENPDRPLFNRALQARYSPGSTIKPMLGIAGLDAGVTHWERTIFDPGYYQLEGSSHRYRNWRRGGHGHVDLHRAVHVSNNTYFYDLGFRLGIDRMHEYMTLFSFGQPTGIDLHNESRGIMPSRQWKRAMHNQAWFHGDTINTSIGQGFMLVTPLQLATATAIYANRGKQLTPSVGYRPDLPPARPDLELNDPQHWERMNKAMGVVTTPQGTARLVGENSLYQSGAKTGTAQVFSIPQESRYNEDELAERLLDHALIITFAPLENPAIAVAVVVENGRYGGSVAGPMARQVMDAWLLNEDGELAVPEPFNSAPPALPQPELEQQ